MAFGVGQLFMDDLFFIKHEIQEMNRDKYVIIEELYMPKVEKVIFNDPATIVIWEDGTKTIVKCQDEDTFDKEKGLAMCFMKRALGNKGNFNDKFNELIDSDYKKNRRKAKKESKKKNEK